MELLGEHISRIVKISRDGGYEYPYINGQNLKILMMQLSAGEYKLRDKEYIELLLAIEKLYNRLRDYDKKHELIKLCNEGFYL
ncbi:hypothetical protein [Jeotgalibacillus soli]|uniref:Uncharacterized protein n=1 Tax=Jeotgalibacillus soli TaxID=889306 RepID=A0A0C2RGS0_9BACL|nr:hypothetical protein [Jeotgalibacillus soli]KIL49370.1 hypothetical protein KP78_08380 [Jeotgalibacillus soli]